MNENDELYVGHILDAIDTIGEYLGDVDEAGFSKDKLLVDGVCRQLSIIGEAASHLSAGFRVEHPEIPFRKIIGLRNVIVHDYTGVNTLFLWETYKADLPQLKKILEPLRPEKNED